MGNVLTDREGALMLKYYGSENEWILRNGVENKDCLLIITTPP